MATLITRVAGKKNAVAQQKAAAGLVVLGLVGVWVAPMADAASVTVSGFVRQEIAYTLSGDNSPFNQQGNPFNGETLTNSFFGDTRTRYDASTDNDFNLMATRGELDFQIKFSEDWSAFVKLRGYFDNNVYKDYDNPNFFEVPFHGDCGTMLEICDDQYMIDLPSAYLDYNSGPLWLRFGNQQIAWGEALFFRVADVANGLDLRRHLFIDWAGEEYADERIASPGIRGSFQLSSEWELEAFAQMFTPSIYGNENTPYNVIASQFVVQQEAGYDKVDDNWNAGLRLRGQFGDLGLQFFAVSRHNPDGVFRWTESNVNPGGPGGELWAASPFEQDAERGVQFADEWFEYAGAHRLHGIAGLDASISEFSGSQGLGAVPVTGDPTGACATWLNAPTSDRDCATSELDLFFGLSPLRGHLAREYPYENVFGWGFNYLFFSEPDSWLDQLLLRFEMSFTPDKKFTNPSLSHQYLEEDEYTASLVLEKYQRFSQNFPATYLVFEYMFKSESDLFGRHLSGQDNDGVPKGDSNFHAVAFAFQQPSPSLKWRYDFALLYDLKGGLMLQPGVRWKPSAGITVEAFANFFDSDGGNDDIMESIEWADELGLRLTYQF